MDPGLDDRLRGSRAAAAAAQGSGYLFTFDFVIEENLFIAFLNGVSLEGFSLQVGETRILRNSIIGAMRVGIVCNGFTLPAMSRVDIASNLLQVFGFGIAAGTDDTRVVDNDVYGLIPARGTGSENPLAAFRIRPDGIALIPSVRPAGMARCQVRGNRLGRILGNAIGVHTEVALTQISHNTIQGTAGDGITMTERASAENLVIEGNQIFAVSLLEDPGERGAGILLQNGIDIAAIGNTISRVGGGAPAGILGHNCLRLRILDNDIGEIGKPEDLGEAFGIVVSGVRVDIQDNAIRRVSDPNAKPSLDTTWWGIMVFGEEPKLAGAEPPPGAADVPGFVGRRFAMANSLSEFVFDATRGRAVELPRGRPAIAVLGNRVEAVGAANAVYMQTTRVVCVQRQPLLPRGASLDGRQGLRRRARRERQLPRGAAGCPGRRLHAPGRRRLHRLREPVEWAHRAERRLAAVPMEPAQRAVGRRTHAYCHHESRRADRGAGSPRLQVRRRALHDGVAVGR